MTSLLRLFAPRGLLLRQTWALGLVLLPGAAPASDSSFALRFSGTGTGQSDRVVLVIDDNAPGTDASTPADLGEGSFTIEFYLRGELADNTAAPAVTFGSSVASNVWINGNIVLDRDIWSDGTGNAADHNRDYGISLAQGRILFGTGSNDNEGGRGPDGLVDGENTIIGSVNVLDGEWHHVACIRDSTTGTKTICIDGVVDFSAAGVSDDDLSFPNDGVALNPASTGANNTLVIGAEKHDAGAAFPSFTGSFDELRLWKAALPKERLVRYRKRILVNPVAGRGPADGFPDLVASFRFEEGSGSSANDSSGATHPNGNNNNAASVITGSPGAAEWISGAADPDLVPTVYLGTDVGGPLVLKTVVTGLVRPVYVTSPPGDTERLFIVEQRVNDVGRILIYKKSSGGTTPETTPFLEIPGINTNNEEGLLGLAFHPDYATNGRFYVYFSDSISGRRSFIREYTASHLFPGGLDDPDRADSISARPILEFTQPRANHNGGWMGFKPGDSNAYLYIATGDGGGSGDNDPGHPDPDPAAFQTGNSQDPTVNLLGKILRIDVDGDDFPDASFNYAIPPTNPFTEEGDAGLDEIWAYGLRNPWRCSFDRETGDFYIGDVGQGRREEINCHPSDGDPAPNFGWRLREGFIQTPNNSGIPNTIGGPRPPGNVDPIIDYSRDEPTGFPILKGKAFGKSVTGGYVYRGSKMPALRGTYFFADYVFDQIFSLRYCGGVVTEHTTRSGELGTLATINAHTISSLGEDAQGNLYVCCRGSDSSVAADGVIQEITQNDFYLWRNQQFTEEELADEALSGLGADRDKDGKTTIEEFLVGDDPNLNDGPLPLVVSVESDGGTDEYLTLTLTRDPQADGLIKVTGATSGAPPLFTPVPAGQVLADSPTTYKFRDHVPVQGGTIRFGRLEYDLE